MMLAAPEFVVAKLVELLHEIEVAAELQHRMLADRMMRGEEGSEFEARHGVSCVVVTFAEPLVGQRCPGFNVRPSGAGMRFPGVVATRHMFLGGMAAYRPAPQIANVIGVDSPNTTRCRKGGGARARL